MESRKREMRYNLRKIKKTNYKEEKIRGTYKKRNKGKQEVNHPAVKRVTKDQTKPSSARKLRELRRDFRLEKALKHAATYGNDRALVYLLDMGVSIEAEKVGQRNRKVFGYSITPLYLAAANDQDKCLKILISQGANIEVKDKLGLNALHVTAEKGYYLCLKNLLKAGADCNTPINSLCAAYANGTTALHLAAKNNHLNCVKELIKFGANCDAVDESGRTSLYVAADAGHSKCALVLLKHGPATAFLSSYCTSDTPLHFAVKNGMVKCVKKLVQLGANVNHINRYGFSPLHLLFSGIMLTHHTKMQIVKLLVLEGHNTDVGNALHQSMFDNWDSELIAFLIVYGANISIENEMNGLSLLEHILTLYLHRDFNLLRCIINCMPKLPHLKTLNVQSKLIKDAEPEVIQENIILQDSGLPENVTLRLVRSENSLYIEIQESRFRIRDMNSGNQNSVFNGKKKYVPLQHPFLDWVYKQVTRDLKKLNEFEIYFGFGEYFLNLLGCKAILEVMQKHLWYEKRASNPRSLKHLSRYSIRKCMGPSNLKHVRELPLPETLHSYLLFQ